MRTDASGDSPADEACSKRKEELGVRRVHPRFTGTKIATSAAVVLGVSMLASCTSSSTTSGTSPAGNFTGPVIHRNAVEKILSYIDIGKKEGAKVLTGGARAKLGGDLENGYYVQPTIFQGQNKMRVFQEEIFGPVVSLTSFKDFDDAIAIANDTLYGLGAGVWSRDGNTAYRAGRDIQAGRVWTNCYHAYPAHAAFGGYKQSGIGRENHKMMLDHYQQTKNLLVSYSNKAQGFF